MLSQAMRIMGAMDADDSGGIEFEEFLAWWDNAPFAEMFESKQINA
jgi:hypothetical protein